MRKPRSDPKTPAPWTRDRVLAVRDKLPLRHQLVVWLGVKSPVGAPPVRCRCVVACIDDPFAERAEFTGSGQRRIAALATRLDGAHPAWRALMEDHRTHAQLTLELLARSDEGSATGGPSVSQGGVCAGRAGCTSHYYGI